VEYAIAAHNSGSLTPTDLHLALDAANLLVGTVAQMSAEPQGTPVPDTGEGGSTAGTVPAPADETAGEDVEDDKA
jgi:hypothetical protein